MKGDHWPTVSPSLNALRNQCTFITVCSVRLLEVEKPNTLFVKAGIQNYNNNNILFYFCTRCWMKQSFHRTYKKCVRLKRQYDLSMNFINKHALVSDYIYNLNRAFLFLAFTLYLKLRNTNNEIVIKYPKNINYCRIMFYNWTFIIFYWLQDVGLFQEN